MTLRIDYPLFIGKMETLSLTHNAAGGVNVPTDTHGNLYSVIRSMGQKVVHCTCTRKYSTFTCNQQARLVIITGFSECKLNVLIDMYDKSLATKRSDSLQYAYSTGDYLVFAWVIAMHSLHRSSNWHLTPVRALAAILSNDRRLGDKSLLRSKADGHIGWFSNANMITTLS